jgi:hypothetical protein
VDRDVVAVRGARAGDSRTHGAGTHDADPADRNPRGALEVGGARGAQLREAHVPERRRRGGGSEHVERCALGAQPFGCRTIRHGEREGDRRLGTGVGAVQPPTVVLDDRRELDRVIGRHVTLGHRSLRPGCRGDRPLEQLLPVHDAVQHTEPEGLIGAEPTGAEDEIDRGLRAGDPHHPLDAAAAGQDAPVELGQGELDVGSPDPTVACQSEFQPTAESETVERGDEGRGGSLDRGEQHGQLRFGDRSGELADVGTRDERAAPADDHGARCAR